MTAGWWVFFRARISSLVEIALLFASVGTVAGYFGALWWPLDLASHFRAQYAVILPSCALVLALLRRGRLALLAALMAIPNVIALVPFLGGSPEVCAPGGEAVKVVSLNVHTSSTEYDAVRSYLQSRDPDVVFLMEVNVDWLRALEPFLERYLYVVRRPRDDNFGIVLATRIEPENLELRELGEAGVPSVLAVFRQPGPLAILGTHPVPPAGGRYSRMRNEQLVLVADKVAALGMPALVIGDLNTTPFSPSFRDFVRRAGLRDPARGGELLFSWSAPIPGLRLPLDHALPSPGLCVSERRLGPDVGSDHRPVEISISLPH